MSTALLDSSILKFDIINFLNEHNIDYSENHKNVGSNWIGIYECPFCGISNYHFGISLETKSCNCWNCVAGKTNLVVYIARVLNITYDESANYIQGDVFLDYEDLEDAVSKIFYENIIPEKTNHNKTIKLPKNVDITKHLLTNKPIIQDFFIRRGLMPKDVLLYDLKVGIEGVTSNKLLIPIMSKKRCVGYQIRSFTSKFYQNVGEIKQYLYKYEEIPKGVKLLLAEGFFDYASTDKFIRKYYGNKYYVTTGFSKKLTPQQIKLIQEIEPEELIYFLDRDAWFEYYNTEQQFNCKTKFIVPPAENNDPGAMREKHFLKVFRDNEL